MLEKEKEEVERLRNLTEEERRIELRNNPKVLFVLVLLCFCLRYTLTTMWATRGTQRVKGKN